MHYMAFQRAKQDAEPNVGHRAQCGGISGGERETNLTESSPLPHRFRHGNSLRSLSLRRRAEGRASRRGTRDKFRRPG